jgi:hypothetical protein
LTVLAHPEGINQPAMTQLALWLAGLLARTNLAPFLLTPDLAVPVQFLTRSSLRWSAAYPDMA